MLYKLDLSAILSFPSNRIVLVKYEYFSSFDLWLVFELYREKRVYKGLKSENLCLSCLLFIVNSKNIPERNVLVLTKIEVISYWLQLEENVPWVILFWDVFRW